MPEETELNENTLGANGIPNLSEAISKLMAHPEILSMAASVLGQNTPSTEAPPSGGDTPSNTVEVSADSSADTAIPAMAGPAADALPDLMRLLGPMLSSGAGSPKKHRHGKGISRSTALLLALKPYLSPARCQTVDRLVQIGKLGELFEKLS